MKSNDPAFILDVVSAASDADVLDVLEQQGLRVDREYGVVRIDRTGRHRVTRVYGNEERVLRAQEALNFSYFPDLTIARTPREEE